MIGELPEDVMVIAVQNLHEKCTSMVRHIVVKLVLCGICHSAGTSSHILIYFNEKMLQQYCCISSVNTCTWNGRWHESTAFASLWWLSVGDQSTLGKLWGQEAWSTPISWLCSETDRIAWRCNPLTCIKEGKQESHCLGCSSFDANFAQSRGSYNLPKRVVPPLNEDKYVENKFDHLVAIVAISEAVDEDWSQTIVGYLCYWILLENPTRRLIFVVVHLASFTTRTYYTKIIWRSILLWCLGEE